MRRGFTLIELIIALGIVVIISAVSLVTLLGKSNRNQLDSTAQQIAAVLHDAQSRAVSQASSTSWGVYFDNSTSTTPYFALFSGTTYSTAAAVSRTTLPLQVLYGTSTLASGATTSVVFTIGTGAAAGSTSIILVQKGNINTSSTLSVATSGLITY